MGKWSTFSNQNQDQNYYKKRVVLELESSKTDFDGKITSFILFSLMWLNVRQSLYETFFFWAHLPAVAKRKLENGIRTAWTVAIFIVISLYWQWSGSLTFFSGIMSIVSHHLYFGHFMETYYQVMVATVVGSSFGTMVGYTSFNTQLQLALLFISLVIINRVTVWERISRVVATLTCFLGAFTLQSIVIDDDGNRRTGGELTMQVVVLLMFVPYTITAVCLLIPIPGLALVSGCRKSRRVLLNLRTIVANVLHSFHDIDSVDVLVTEADILIAETRPVVEYIATNSRYGANESLLIPAGDLPAFLKTFSAFATQSLDELSGMLAMMKLMPLNLTHLMFADRLRSGLTDFANEVDQILSLMEERLNLLDFYPSIYRRFCSFDHQEYSKLEQQRLTSLYQVSVEKINDICAKLLNEYREVRINYVFYKAVRAARSESAIVTLTANQESKFSDATIDISVELESTRFANEDYTNNSSGTSAVNSVLMSMKSVPEIEMHRTNTKQKGGLFRRHASAADRFSHPPPPARAAHVIRSLESHRVDIVKSYLESSHQTDEDIRSLIERETDHLSVKNISYRSAYMSRLFLLQSLVANSANVFTQKHTPVPIIRFLEGELEATFRYFVSFKDMKLDYAFLRSIVQPAKIAGAVTLTGLFITVPSLSTIRGPLWPGITICFIRQDMSASSFLTCYQRLEGTVLGCFFTIIVYTALQCPDVNFCNQSNLAPLLIVWTAVTCYFREGPMHGYTGVTAALTPIVLLIGYVDSEVNILFRVFNTIIAIVIYLFIDMFILPTRTDVTVRTSVIKCMSETTDAFSNAVDAVQHLLKYCKESMQSSKTMDTSNKKDENILANDAACVPSMQVCDSVIEDSKFVDGTSEVVFGMNVVDTDTSISDKIKPSFSTNLNVEKGDESTPLKLEFMIEIPECDCALGKYEIAIRSMIKRQKGLVAVLKLGLHEPEVFNRPFPLQHYTKLNDLFASLIESIVGVAGSARALRSTLQSLVMTHEDVEAYLQLFSFMTKKLFLVADNATRAMRAATAALEK